MRRIAFVSAIGLTLVAGLVTAGSVRADEAPPADLQIGSPPPCGDEEAATLSGVECAGIEPVDSIGPIPVEIEAAAAATARA